MTNSGLMRPLVLGAVLLSISTMAPAADLTQNRGGSEPRLAWLGNERPALERSSRRQPVDAWRPGIWDGLYGGINGGFGWGLWRVNLGETGGGDRNGMRRPVAASSSCRFVPAASGFAIPRDA